VLPRPCARCDHHRHDLVLEHALLDRRGSSPLALEAKESWASRLIPCRPPTTSAVSPSETVHSFFIPGSRTASRESSRRRRAVRETARRLEHHVRRPRHGLDPPAMKQSPRRRRWRARTDDCLESGAAQPVHGLARTSTGRPASSTPCALRCGCPRRSVGATEDHVVNGARIHSGAFDQRAMGIRPSRRTDVASAPPCLPQEFLRHQR